MKSIIIISITGLIVCSVTGLLKVFKQDNNQKMWVIMLTIAGVVLSMSLVYTDIFNLFNQLAILFNLSNLPINY